MSKTLLWGQEDRCFPENFSVTHWKNQLNEKIPCLKLETVCLKLGPQEITTTHSRRRFLVFEKGGSSQVLTVDFWIFVFVRHLFLRKIANDHEDRWQGHHVAVSFVLLQSLFKYNSAAVLLKHLVEVERCENCGISFVHNSGTHHVYITWLSCLLSKAWQKKFRPTEAPQRHGEIEEKAQKAKSLAWTLN